MPSSFINFNAPIPKFNAENLSASSSFGDLLGIIPKAAQPFYKGPLKEVFELGVKISHVQYARNSFQEYTESGNLPPSIDGAIKMPKLQCSKEFVGTEAWVSLENSAAQQIKALKKSFLQAFLETKKSEEEFLVKETSEEKFRRLSSKIALEFYKSCSSTSNPNGVSFDELVKPPKEQAMQASLQPATHDYFPFRDEIRTCNQMGSFWLRRAVQLGLAKHQTEILAKKTRENSKKEADTVMRDFSSTDINKTLQQIVSKELRKLSIQNNPKNSHRKPLFQNRVKKSANFLRTRQTSRLEAEESSPEAFEQATSSEEKAPAGRKRKWQWEQEEAEKLNILQEESNGISFHNLSSYPPSFWKQDVQTRARFLLVNSSTEFIQSISSYQSEVFKGPGVFLPREFEQTLSFNGKFVFHTQPKIELVFEAYKKLERSIRIRYCFKDRPENSSYIPEFYTPKPWWEPPPASENLENALLRTKAILSSSAKKGIKALRKKQLLLNPNLRETLRYLSEKNYLLKITDKNLGLAVLSTEWYKNQCEIHLQNSVAYELREADFEILNDQLADIYSLTNLPAQIRDYLRESERKIPKFHVIPKVHKKPWSSRPIVPSHSWITSRVGKVIDWALQPLLSEFPSVLHSTQDLLEKIRTIEGPFDDCWLVTGDVSAMYTNIPKDKAVELITTLYPNESKKIKKYHLKQMMEFVLSNNFFKYEDRIYKQKSGLAMGVACAPVIANLFCAVYEKQRLKYRNKHLRFYGRYIDDIFMVFKGTEAELQLFLHQWKFPELQVNWEWSRNSVPFLDVEFRLFNGNLTTKMYEKALNKHQYIPFSSAHPLSVKRAFVKAERTRYKLICSQEDDFHRTELNLKNNLLRRGYPLKILEQWLAEPLGKTARPEPAFILPSEYNPIWEYIRIGPVKDVLVKYARGDLPDLDKLVTSLKRGRSFYDSFALHNLTVLNTLDIEGE